MRSFVLACALFGMAMCACKSDASKTKEMTGTWGWKPRSELPPDLVVDKGFPTPEAESLELRADGTYVHVEQIPGYDTVVAEKPFHVSERWEEWRGTWSFAKGELSLGESTPGDRWGASRQEKGWRTEAIATGGARTFELVALTKTSLELHDLAVGGYDRKLHAATTMPARPTIATTKP